MLSFFSRIIAFFLALFFLGSVSSLDPSPLYATCSSEEISREEPLPFEHTKNDPAFFAKETLAPEYQTPERMTELGFTHVVGMWNIVSVLPCDRGNEAGVTFRSLQIIERDRESGSERVVQNLSFNETSREPVAPSFDYTTYYREPWFTGGGPSFEPIAAAITDDGYEVNARFVPKVILHGWTEPRVQVVPGREYFLEATLKIAGDARVQLGMDYWKGTSSEYNGWSAGYLSSNNCQAWLRDWHGDTDGEFISWLVPSLRMNG